MKPRVTPACAVAVSLLALFFAMAGCGLGDLPFSEVDKASIPAQPTYIHDIGPRMNFYCTGCHSSGDDATAGWDFSTIDKTCSQLLLAIDAAFVKRSMPPGGAERMQARDKGILEKWQSLNCPQCNDDGDCDDGERCVTTPCKDGSGNVKPELATRCLIAPDNDTRICQK